MFLPSLRDVLWHFDEPHTASGIGTVELDAGTHRGRRQMGEQAEIKQNIDPVNQKRERLVTGRCAANRQRLPSDPESTAAVSQNMPPVAAQQRQLGDSRVNHFGAGMAVDWWTQCSHSMIAL